MDANSSRRRFYSFSILVVVSVLAMIVDDRTALLQSVRNSVSVVAEPLRRVSSSSLGLGGWFARRSLPEDHLIQSYQELERNYLLAKAELQKARAIEAENRRLSRLLAASEKIGDDVLLAELIEVSLEPNTHRVVVNRGTDHSVFVGQPVIDAEGVMGQVTRVSPQSSAITLLTDAGHAIPVQVRRNGLRAIVYGVGVPNRLSVPYLPPQADVRQSDMLVTSGLGGRFPAGHPVAVVNQVVADANEPFLMIDATPVARLDYARNVLLVWPGSYRPPVNQEQDAAKQITAGQLDKAEPIGTNIASGDNNGS